LMIRLRPSSLHGKRRHCFPGPGAKADGGRFSAKRLAHSAPGGDRPRGRGQRSVGELRGHRERWTGRRRHVLQEEGQASPRLIPFQDPGVVPELILERPFSSSLRA
jgi:hypothetical protein